MFVRIVEEMTLINFDKVRYVSVDPLETIEGEPTGQYDVSAYLDSKAIKIARRISPEKACQLIDDLYIRLSKGWNAVTVMFGSVNDTGRE